MHQCLREKGKKDLLMVCVCYQFQTLPTILVYSTTDLAYCTFNSLQKQIVESIYYRIQLRIILLVGKMATLLAAAYLTV